MQEEQILILKKKIGQEKFEKAIEMAKNLINKTNDEIIFKYKKIFESS